MIRYRCRAAASSLTLEDAGNYITKRRAPGGFAILKIGPMQPLIAVKRATMLLRFDWLLGLIGALLS